jgi:phosphoglycerate dehydrogenase-like enzyme
MRIVLCGETFPPSRDILAPFLPDEEVVRVPVATLDDAVRGADVLIPMMTRVGARLIARTSARLIQQWGAGLEGVDVDAASARGIYVCNVPSDVTPNAESTAEHAVLLMLASARRLRVGFTSFERGLWGAPLGESLFGKRALIFGFGRIGKALARRLVALGMEVDAIRRSPQDDEADRAGVRSVAAPGAFLSLAAEADFVVSTATLTDDSRGLIGDRLFRVMKRSAFVINVSRGAIIDEPALLQALNEERIAGAGLDVFADEPIDASHPLLACENVIATPHIGGVTRESYDGIAREIAANVIAVKEGRLPQYCVNHGALTR